MLKKYIRENYMIPLVYMLDISNTTAIAHKVDEIVNTSNRHIYRLSTDYLQVI